jgi:hypothetical protein
VIEVLEEGCGTDIRRPTVIQKNGDFAVAVASINDNTHVQCVLQPRRIHLKPDEEGLGMWYNACDECRCRVDEELKLLISVRCGKLMSKDTETQVPAWMRSKTSC